MLHFEYDGLTTIFARISYCFGNELPRIGAIAFKIVLRNRFICSLSVYLIVQM